MRRLPFTADQFFEVFRSYNQDLWPAPLILNGVALVLVVLAIARPDRQRPIWLGLAGLWLWTATFYHLAHFTVLTAAGYVFAVFFLAQAALLHRAGRLALTDITPARGWPATVGGLLILYALVLYPLLGLATGHAYRMLPTFGTPCPLTLFTFGLLLWTRPAVPMHLLIIPTVWSFIGLSAALQLGVPHDAGMPVAAVIAWSIAWAQKAKLRRTGAGWRQLRPRPLHVPRS